MKINASQIWKPVTAAAIGIGLLLYTWTQVQGVASAARGVNRNPQLAPAASEARVRAEGRLATYPGAQVVVSTDLAGTLQQVLVQEKSPVKRGQLLAEIKVDEQRAALAEARAHIAEVQADLRFLEGETDRLRRLLQSGAASQQAYDRAERDRDAARARLQTAQATAARIQAVLDKARITAPINGVVLLRHAEPGETVPAGARIVTLADLSRVRVEAEVDEFDLDKIALGSEVQISAEGFSESWLGRVEEIPDAVGSPKLKPQDPGKPADTRVLLVKVALTSPTPLKLGQRVEVAVSSRSEPNERALAAEGRR